MSLPPANATPSATLRDWVQSFNDQLGLGLELNEEALTLFENQEGSNIAVQALDDAGLILISSDLIELPESTEAQLALLKTVAFANYRGLVTGPAKISLHPEGKYLFLELPLLSPHVYSVDDFAEKLNAFMQQHQTIQQGLSDGSLETQFAQTKLSSGEPDPSEMIRI